MTRRRTASRRGITLFEVVLGLVIFLVAYPALNTLVQMGTFRAEEAQYVAQASLHCRSKLAELSVGAEPLEGTDWTPLGELPNWSWRAEVTPAELANLHAVQVWVKFETGGRPIETTMSRFLLDPSVRGSTQDRGLIDAANQAAMSSSGTTSGTTTGTSP